MPGTGAVGALLLRLLCACLTALSSGATPASRTEGERSETEVKAAGVVACSELLGGGPLLRCDWPLQPAAKEHSQLCTRPMCEPPGQSLPGHRARLRQL